jgi:predicted nucleic acid-binding protein
MTTVIDASIAVKCFFEEPGSEFAKKLLYSASEANPIVAPALIMLEVQGILAKQFALGALTKEQLSESSNTLQSLIVVRPLDLKDAQEAIKLSMLAMQLTAASGDVRPLPANVYDCAYIVTAFAENAELVTADQRQAAIALSVGCKVRLIRN